MKTAPIARALVLVAGGAAIAVTAGGVDQGHRGANSVAPSTPVTSSSLVCPGASHATFGVSSAPSALDRSLTTGGSVMRRAGTSASTAVALTRGSTVSFTESSSPVQVSAGGGLAPGLAATQYDTTGAALSARACTASANEAWIPVGQKQSGRLLTLVLVNSGAHAASVDVDVRAADGDVPGAQVLGQAVEAHSRVQLNLAVDAVTHPGAVVHVSSEGGAIQSSVIDSSATGDPQGIEVAAQYAAAAAVQSVPGVPVFAGKSSVRLAAPSGAAAVVRVQAWGDKDASSHDQVVTIQAGRTLDVTVSGLHGDFATVRATAQTPIVVAGYGTSAEHGSKDFVWVSAAPDIEGLAGASVKGAGQPGTAVLTSDGRARTVTVVIVDGQGTAARRTVNVPAGGDTRIALPVDSSVWVQAPTQNGLSGVRGSVLVRASGNGAITNVPLVPSPWRRVPIVLNQN